jgi:hypothetical protein
VKEAEGDREEGIFIKEYIRPPLGFVALRQLACKSKESGALRER